MELNAWVRVRTILIGFGNDSTCNFSIANSQYMGFFIYIQDSIEPEAKFTTNNITWGTVNYVCFNSYRGLLPNLLCYTHAFRAWQQYSPAILTRGVGINKAVTHRAAKAQSSLICRRLAASPQLEIYRSKTRDLRQLRHNPIDGSLSHYPRCTGCTR